MPVVTKRLQLLPPEGHEAERTDRTHSPRLLGNSISVGALSWRVRRIVRNEFAIGRLATREARR